MKSPATQLGDEAARGLEHFSDSRPRLQSPAVVQAEYGAIHRGADEAPLKIADGGRSFNAFAQAGVLRRFAPSA